MPSVSQNKAIADDLGDEVIQFIPKTTNALKLTLYGAIFPSKKNSKLIAFNKKVNKPYIISSPDYQKWALNTQILVIAWRQEQKLKHGVKFPIESCALSAVIYYPDRRRRDLSNSIEGVNDVLVASGVLKDDCWTNLNPLSIRGRISASKPRIELYISQPLQDEYSK